MKYLLTGGGTGGHVYPALALADEIRRHRPDAEFLYIGLAKKLESWVVPGRGYPIQFVHSRPCPRSSSPWSWLAFSLTLGLGVMKAIFLCAALPSPGHNRNRWLCQRTGLVRPWLPGKIGTVQGQGLHLRTQRLSRNAEPGGGSAGGPHRPGLRAGWPLVRYEAGGGGRIPGAPRAAEPGPPGLPSTPGNRRGQSRLSWSLADPGAPG